MNSWNKKTPKHLPTCEKCVHLMNKNGYRCKVWDKRIWNPRLAGFSCEAKELKFNYGNYAEERQAQRTD
uniref:Uncharacterized protein n=1 Tax=viral metagenome TaxID=1070528 RepID=A0A6M3JU47_9ZZZZ